MKSISRKGFSLPEIVTYVAVLALAAFVLTNSITTMMKSFRLMKTSGNIENAAVVSMERMTREIRDANSVGGSSVLDSHPGSLYLNSTNADLSSKSVEFYLNSGRIGVREDGLDKGFLTGSSTNISNLVFRSLSSGISDAVRIEMTVEGGEGSGARSRNFYSTVVLRGSYE